MFSRSLTFLLMIWETLLQTQLLIASCCKTWLNAPTRPPDTIPPAANMLPRSLSFTSALSEWSFASKSMPWTSTETFLSSNGLVTPRLKLMGNSCLPMMGRSAETAPCSRTSLRLNSLRSICTPSSSSSWPTEAVFSSTLKGPKSWSMGVSHSRTVRIMTVWNIEHFDRMPCANCMIMSIVGTAAQGPACGPGGAGAARRARAGGRGAEGP
mmetsp:Transcript_52512/g.168376  ORF Transcript_52512/g.168376 Transcript_52512/m.168376 type:complete len:211 (+) Transcript_52512:187-819(+)